MTIRSTLAALAAVSMLAWPAQALTLDGVTIDTGTQIDVESDLSYDPFGEILDFTGLVTGTTADLFTLPRVPYIPPEQGGDASGSPAR